MKTLKDKVVAITGAASGIGRALAERCAAEGAKLAIADWDQAGLKETAAKVKERGAAVRADKVNVADRDAVYAWAAAVADTYGGAAVIVNNAGVSLSETIADIRYEDFEWLFDINFWGVVYGTKAFLPQLVKQPEGHVVNISSVFGIIAVPTQAAYNAAKFAVRGFTEALRQELRETQVHVTCVHPGGIKTNIARNGRHYIDPKGRATDTEAAAAQFEKMARTSPEDAAAAILGAILQNKPRLLIGADAHVIDAIARTMPEAYPNFINRAMRLIDRR